MLQVSLGEDSVLLPGLAGTQRCQYSCPSRATGLSPVLHTAPEPHVVLGANLSLLPLGSRDQNIFELR